MTEAQAREAMRLASHKLPISTKFVKRAEPTGELADDDAAFDGDDLVETGDAETVAAETPVAVAAGTAPAEAVETASEPSVSPGSARRNGGG